MSTNWDHEVSGAKNQVTRALCEAVDRPSSLADLGMLIDRLNTAWDGLTDALMHQRCERDRIIQQLLNELATLRNDTN